MRTVLHIGPVGTFNRPTLVTDGDEIARLSTSGPQIIARILGTHVYAVDAADSPIATVDGAAIYAGSDIFDDPIATVEGSQIYAGRRGVTDDPIATVQGDARHAGALAAAFILLT